MIGRFRVWALKRWTGFSPTRLKSIAVDSATNRPFCTTEKKNNNKKKPNESDKDTGFEARLAHYDESYRQLENLDFMTAAKISFAEPPVKKKFGLDFHLVQLFFALMPSFAVYLIAQYARHEMKKMEAELEVKKKKEEEEKAKELERQEAAEIEKRRSSPEFMEVKSRLDKLEETVKEIAVESKKKQSGGESGDEKKHPMEEPSKIVSKAEERGQGRAS